MAYLIKIEKGICMKKRLLLLTMCVTALNVTGCKTSASTEKVEPIVSTTVSAVKAEVATVEEVATEKSSEMTEIVYLAMLSYNQTIDDFVNKLNEKNSDFNASVYDDKHYSVMMLESERKSTVDAFKKTGIDENLGKLINNEKYEGIFTHYEYTKDLKSITLYSNSAEGGMKFVEATINAGVLSDAYQALNLIPIDKREYGFKILDESGNLLYPKS